MIKTNQIDRKKSLSWRNFWYPITFTKDLFLDKPLSFTIFDENFVLFKDELGNLSCIENLCPHRGAKLSDGQIIDGKIECLYHGWQFNIQGECVHIPQLSDSAKIPKNACIKSYETKKNQGIIWVWLGDEKIREKTDIFHISDLDNPDCFLVDTVTDLPYDYTYLIENIADPSHVPISHDRTELGITRDAAKPLSMKIVENSARGIIGKYKNLTSNNWSTLTIYPPHFATYNFSNVQANFIMGFVFFAVPITWGKCRFFVRRYGNFYKKSFTMKPRWLEHLRQSKVLEEDLEFIVAQQEWVDKNNQHLQDLFLPLKTSDVFVLEYRKWLDKYGDNYPFYEGYKTAKRTKKYQGKGELVNRFSRHTKHCRSCLDAYQNTIKLKNYLMAIAIILFSLAIFNNNFGMKLVEVLTALLAIIGVIICQQLKQKFE